MELEINQVGPDSLARYARIPVAFRVESVLRIVPSRDPLTGIQFREERLHAPYVKNYDSYEGEEPTCVAKRWDVTNWGIFIACVGQEDVGGAVVALNTPGFQMLEGRSDLAALWDIRVDPDWRRKGVGTRLLRHAAESARAQGCIRLNIETQNVNVAACRFYARQGCRLRAIDCDYYTDPPEVRGEIMLLWRLDLHENAAAEAQRQE